MVINCDLVVAVCIFSGEQGLQGRFDLDEEPTRLQGYLIYTLLAHSNTRMACDAWRWDVPWLMRRPGKSPSTLVALRPLLESTICGLSAQEAQCSH
jgi:hypothetical protein